VTEDDDKFRFISTKIGSCGVFRIHVYDVESTATRPDDGAPNEPTQRKDPTIMLRIDNGP
jgi:hypothetical protein